MGDQLPSNQLPEDMQRISDVQATHADELLQKANVVGVGIGLRRRAQSLMQERCLVVMVERKVPLEELAPDDRIPREIEGVPVDIQEVGKLSAF